MADEQTTQNTEQTTPAENTPKPEQKSEQKSDEKKFSQAEVDSIVEKRLARQARELQKADKNGESEQELSSVRKEVEELKKQLSAERVEAALRKQAAALGVDSKSVDYVVRLADLNDVLTEDGKPDEAKLTAAVNKVLADIPALKPQKSEQKGIRVVGSAGKETESSAGSDEEKMRRAMGLKPKS